MGTATAGISWAALVADKMELPMGYVRSSNKDHGKGNKIEGNLPKGAKVVIVEDLIFYRWFCERCSRSTS